MAYASLAQLKEYLGTSSPTDDDLMTRLLAAAQAGIEQNRGGRRFEAVDEASDGLPGEFVAGGEDEA